MIRRILLISSTLFLFSPLALAGQPGYRQGKATASEVLMLPRFCWWEYNAAYKDTQLEIRNCGPGMNHYCSALVKFSRAERMSDRFKRIDTLNSVLRDVEYTLGWMKDYPGCSIRQNVLQNYSRVRACLHWRG